ICYAVFHQLFLGFNQTNVPNIELVLSRYPGFVTQNSTTEWLTERNIEDDANPVSFIVDLLKNPRFGCALGDERIDKIGMVATADSLDASEFGISPIINRSQETRQTISSALEYFDGYPLATADGTLSVRCITAPGEDLPEITDADLLARP